MRWMMDMKKESLVKKERSEDEPSTGNFFGHFNSVEKTKKKGLSLVNLNKVSTKIFQ